MIRAAYLIKNTGEPLYIKYYDLQVHDEDAVRVPQHVRTCVMLLSSRSTAKGQTYTMQHGATVWVYYFLDMFTAVIEATSDEPIAHLKKRTLSLGKAVSRVYGPLISSWAGSMNSVEGLAELIDKFALLELVPQRRSRRLLERAVTRVLERHPVAYVGVLDSIGDLLHGNIPEEHLKRIRLEIDRVGVTPSADLVPMTVVIDGHPVQLLRVQSLLLVTASYRDGDRLDAVRAIDELAEMVTKTATGKRSDGTRSQPDMTTP